MSCVVRYQIADDQEPFSYVVGTKYSRVRDREIKTIPTAILWMRIYWANQRRRPFRIERTGWNIKGQFCRSHVPSVIQKSHTVWLTARARRKTTFPRLASSPTRDKYARLLVRVGSGEAVGKSIPFSHSQRTMAAQNVMSADQLRLALSTPVDFPACL